MNKTSKKPKRFGFTLLELIIVIIIIGVLATLGFTQYSILIENMRTAEAKVIFGMMRKSIINYWQVNGSVSSMASADLNIGTSSDQIPSTCRSTHYYSYSWWQTPRWGDTTGIGMSATRCSSGGKQPNNSGVYYELRFYFDPPTWNTGWACVEPAGVFKWDAPDNSGPAACP